MMHLRQLSKRPALVSAHRPWYAAPRKATSQGFISMIIQTSVCLTGQGLNANVAWKPEHKRHLLEKRDHAIGLQARLLARDMTLAVGYQLRKGILQDQKSQ